MDTELIERLAQEAGTDMERFASLVAEECAKLCESKKGDPAGYGLHFEPGYRCAAAIRAKFKA